MRGRRESDRSKQVARILTCHAPSSGSGGGAVIDGSGRGTTGTGNSGMGTIEGGGGAVSTGREGRRETATDSFGTRIFGRGRDSAVPGISRFGCAQPTRARTTARTSNTPLDAEGFLIRIVPLCDISTHTSHIPQTRAAGKSAPPIGNCPIQSRISRLANGIYTKRFDLPWWPLILTARDTRCPIHPPVAPPISGDSVLDSSSPCKAILSVLPDRFLTVDPSMTLAAATAKAKKHQRNSWVQK